MSNRVIRVRRSMLSELIAASILNSMHSTHITHPVALPPVIHFRSEMQSPAPAPRFIEAKCEGKIDDCSICLSEVNVGDNLILLPCCHTFHKNCISQWLIKNNTCPICRETC